MILMTQVIHEDGKGTIMSVSDDMKILSMLDPETEHIDLSILDNYRGKEGILRRIYDEDGHREEIDFIIKFYDHDKQELHLEFVEE